MPAPFSNTPKIKQDEGIGKGFVAIFMIIAILSVIFLLYWQDLELKEIHKLPKIPVENCKAYWGELFDKNKGSTSGLIEMSKKYQWQCSEYLETHK